MGWLKRFINYVLTWRKHRAIIKELNQLTDAELRDIGLTRGTIDQVIWLEIDKQKRGTTNG